MTEPGYNITYVDSCIIGDFAEKMEAEAFTQGENSLLILENVFFHPEEAGFLMDEQNKLEHINFSERQKFAETIASYSDFMIVNSDQQHFFDTYATQTRIINDESDLEYCVSKEIKDQLDFFIYTFGNEKRKPRILLMGGLP